jgi:hypothetical protein
MSTTTIWDDNFSSYPLGPGHPTGWFDPGGDTQFVDFGTMTGHSQAPGFFEQTGHGLVLAGDSISYIDTTSTDSSAQVTWLSFGNVYDLVFSNVDLSTYTGFYPGAGNPMCGLLINPDYTASLWVRGTSTSAVVGVFPFATTTQQVYYPNTWQSWQLNVEFGQIVIGSVALLTVLATLGLEGVEVCSGFVTTNLPVTDLYTGQPIVNEFSFGGSPASSGYFANFTGITGSPLPPIGAWPHPGTPDAYYTQSVAEVIKLPSSLVRQARYTQGVNEVIKLPSSSVRQARVTQGVVEIIRRVPPSLGYWVCYEA